MAEQRSDDRSQARCEAAALLGVDIDRLSPADGLRVDMVSALRLVIDHEQSCVLSGGSADLGKLNVAVQSLIALLPGRELPAPESQREDPRVKMFEIYMKRRRNGEINLRVPGEGLQAKITQLESENAQLRAALGGSIEILGVDEGTIRGDRNSENSETGGKKQNNNKGNQSEGSENSDAITPREADVTPPGEIGEFYRGVVRGPDDPKPPVTIEAHAVRPNPPAAPAAPKYDYDKEQGWRDHVLSDGTITPTPMSSSRRWWGPV